MKVDILQLKPRTSSIAPSGNFFHIRSPEDLAPGTIVLADKAYDSDAIRRLIEQQGAVTNIPSKGDHRWKSGFSRTLYNGRDAVERMFCRLKDYRCIATRYDKLANNFLAAIYLIAATVVWWL